MIKPTENLKRRALPIPDACVEAGVGRSFLYEALKDGSLKAVKAGRKTLIMSSELDRWLGTLPAAEFRSEREAA